MIEKDGKYYISGLPWFSAIESSQAGHFSEDDQLQLTANDHFSDTQRKKVEKFLKVFFTNYTTNQDNLNLIAKDVDIIANTTFKTIDYTYLKKDGKNIIAYVQATFEVRRNHSLRKLHLYPLRKRKDLLCHKTRTHHSTEYAMIKNRRTL